MILLSGRICRALTVVFFPCSMDAFPLDDTIFATSQNHGKIIAGMKAICNQVLSVLKAR